MLFGGLCAFTAALLAACSAQAAAASPDPPGSGRPAYHRGVNILGYDPFWKNPARARFKAHHFNAIRKGGFDFVRVNLFVFDHLDSADRIDPNWLGKLDWVVREARKARLGIILDEHDFNDCSLDPKACRTKLMAVWQQLAARYRNEPAQVAFELLNEPHGALDAAEWNAMIVELLKIVRATNPRRTVVIGPTSWNSLAELPSLQLPDGDRNILVTFHYYEPFRFTHQGAGWTEMKNVSGITWGSDADKAAVRADFDKVAKWASDNRRPILLGEFGAYDRSGTPIAMRVGYTGDVAREAERHGFAWAYWQFDSDFIVWDMKSDSWVAPIKSALIPELR